MDHILRTFNVSKQFKGQKVVDNLSINVEKGRIYGFLGQNGAGKTTTIRMIMGLMRPTSGSIELFGEIPAPGAFKHYSRIGAIIETPGAYSNLTAVENLEIHRRLMGIPDRKCIDEVLDMVGLYGMGKKPVRNFSLGMKQRLGMARALMHHPELLILDEPTNGLDPVGIKEVRQLLVNLVQKRKITVFMSSHILNEVQLLADRIGIIHNGRLLEEIDYDTLKRKTRHYIELKVDNDKKASLVLETKLGIGDYGIPEPGTIRVYERLNDAGDMNRELIGNGIEVRNISMMNSTLEDYFVELTGGAANV